MTAIAKNQSGAVALPSSPAELSADLAAVLLVMQSGVSIIARDLTQARVDEARAIAGAQSMTAPAQQIIIAAWVKKLIPLTANPPTNPADSAAKISAICEICGDFPAGVWTPQTRKAWVTQGTQGKFWPAPAELYAHLLPYAEKIRRDVAGCRKIVRLAERAGKRAEGVSEDERKAAAAQMAAWRKSMGHDEPQLVRRPVAPQPSVSERLAAYRAQLQAEPEAGVWILPLIAQLEVQAGRNVPKEPLGLAESVSMAF